MAKANTFEVDKIGRYTNQQECAMVGCISESKFRAWFYPAFMNGDSEWCEDYCEKHKPNEQELRKICKGTTLIKYKID